MTKEHPKQFNGDDYKVVIELFDGVIIDLTVFGNNPEHDQIYER